MFCKSGILIFIFAENDYSIYANTMLIKTPLLHQSSGTRVLSFSPPLSFSGWSPGAQRLSEFTFLPGLLRPSREGAQRFHPIEWVPEASVNRASPVPGALLAFCINQGISASFSPFLSYCQLWTTRFWSSKGPQQYSNVYNVCIKARRWHFTISLILGMLLLLLSHFSRVQLCEIP